MKKNHDKRGALLSAALELFAENGLEGASTAAIARRAGVGTGTLFLYFKNKEELILELYREVQTRIAGAGVPGVAEFDLRQRFQDMMADYLRFFLLYPHMLIFCENFHFSRYRPLGADIPEAFQSLSALLSEGREAGVIKDLPLFVLESLAISPLVSIAREQFSRGTTVDDALIDDIVRACWDAVGVSG